MFLALPEKTAESAPAEIAVICQVAVLDPPADRLAALKVGALTEKWPLCELRLAETLDSPVYAALLALTIVFLIVAVTVAVWPTVIVEGI